MKKIYQLLIVFSLYSAAINAQEVTSDTVVNRQKSTELTNIKYANTVFTMAGIMLIYLHFPT